MDKMKDDTVAATNEPRTTAAPPRGRFRLGAGKPESVTPPTTSTPPESGSVSPKLCRTPNDKGQGAPQNDATGNLGQIPLISEAIAARRVKNAELKVGKVLTEANTVAAEVAVACSRKIQVQAAIRKVRESARGLSEDARRPLLDRLAQAEQRLEKETPSACEIPPKKEEQA